MTTYATTRHYLKSRAIGLHRMGMPLKDIATHVERSPLTVDRWLKEKR